MKRTAQMEELVDPKWGFDQKRPSEAKRNLTKIRRMIILKGIPEHPVNKTEISLRGKVWKLMLSVHPISAQEYIDLVSKGASDFEIDNDTFRTFATDRDFTSRVSEDHIRRVLNAFVTKGRQTVDPKFSFGYVQGMNVLVAPILYVMPELDAFFCFDIMIRKTCPTYVQRGMIGAHEGTKLIDECLRIIDPEMFQHLQTKKLHADLYAFRYILSLCACTPPLKELLKIWDFFFAFGFHLVVLCVIAQMTLIKDKIMRSASPMELLNRLPELNASKIIPLTVRLIEFIPDDLYNKLIKHTVEMPTK